MKLPLETKQPSEIQALIIRLLPPEEFGEDANVEECIRPG